MKTQAARNNLGVFDSGTYPAQSAQKIAAKVANSIRKKRAARCVIVRLPAPQIALAPSKLRGRTIACFFIYATLKEK